MLVEQYRPMHSGSNKRCIYDDGVKYNGDLQQTETFSKRHLSMAKIKKMHCIIIAAVAQSM
jgi:hypothetical protein